MLLLGLPALPIPTGGATHVFEIIAVLLALQLIAGRDEIWLLGVVLLSLAVLLEDILLAIVAFVVGLASILLSLFLGAAAIDAVRGLA